MHEKQREHYMNTKVSRMPVIAVEVPAISNGRTVLLEATPASAGFPSPAADDLEDEIDPISWVVRHPSSTFWWRVEGNCLWDAGIRDGDLIAVDRAGKRRVGRAVLAVIDGDVIAKILRKAGDKYFLSPANSQESFPDIELNEDSEILGVIAGDVRRYDLE
jgi:DNA polymerase V